MLSIACTENLVPPKCPGDCSFHQTPSANSYYLSQFLHSFKISLQNYESGTLKETTFQYCLIALKKISRLATEVVLSVIFTGLFSSKSFIQLGYLLYFCSKQTFRIFRLVYKISPDMLIPGFYF